MSLQPKGFSGVLSNTPVPNRQFFSAQPSLWSNSHILTWLPLPLRGATIQQPRPRGHRPLGPWACLCHDSLHVAAPSPPTAARCMSPKALQHLPLDVSMSKAQIKLLAPSLSSGAFQLKKWQRLPSVAQTTIRGKQQNVQGRKGRKGAGRSMTQGRGGGRQDASERGYSQPGRTPAHSERQGPP